MQRIILIITLIAFLALTATALLHHGYWGILEPHFKSFWHGAGIGTIESMNAT